MADLDFRHLQQREEHWAIVDLVGKGGHIRTVPLPDWVKTTIDEWLVAAAISAGRVFRCVCRVADFSSKSRVFHNQLFQLSRKATIGFTLAARRAGM